MITLLSPSKKLNFKHQDAVSAFTQCDFIESAQELVNKAKNLTSQDLKDLMKISDSLADLNKERFNNWSLPFNKDNAKGEGNKSLLTDDMYASFEIMFEWKLSPNSNSGFMWGVKEGDQYEEPYVTGPEIQIMDNEYPDGVKAGGLWGMVYPEEDMSNFLYFATKYAKFMEPIR